MFLRLLAVILLLLAAPALAQGPPARPSSASAVTPAPDDRAREWLALVDAKDYAQAWHEAAKPFQARQTAEAWTSQIAGERESLGAVASRDLKSIDLSRNTLAVIRYDTVFAHRPAAVETVTLAPDNDGWSVSAYSVN